MKSKKFLWLGLATILVLVVLYVIFVFQLPQLIHISQRLGIDLSWRAFREYIEEDLIGMTEADVHLLLRELYPDASIQRLYASRCERIQMGNAFEYFAYIFCYIDDRLNSVRVSS